MHVAQFIQRYPPALGGAEAYFARLSRFLSDQDDRVAVFTSNALDLSAFWSRKAKTLPIGVSQLDGVEVHRFPCWRWPGRRYLLKLLSFVPNRAWQCMTMPCNPLSPGMWGIAKSHPGPVDVVHASAFPYAWPILCARHLSRVRGVPFCLTPFLHLGDPDDPNDPTRRAYTAPQLRWLLREADLVFAQTEGERRAIVDLGVPEDRVVLQGLGVDFAECTGGDRTRARRGWGVEGEATVVGLLANQSKEKGTLDLLLALEPLLRDGIGVKVVLAGPEMPNFQAFWATFASRVLPGTVTRLGVLSAEQKRDFFAGIDLFVLPSRSDSFGLVLLEAWANGVANIGYRAGGIAGVIRDGVDGVLTPCGDIGALRAEIHRLVRNAEVRRQMGQAGQDRAARDFRWHDKLTLVRDRLMGAAFLRRTCKDSQDPCR